MILRLRFLLFLIACPAFMLVSPASAQNGDAIVIGQVIDLSSPNAALGRDYVAGIKTYFDMLNAAGGINGRKIRYIARDDQASPQSAARAASELIDNERVDYLLGGIGENVTRAILDAPTFRRSRLQLYAPLIGNTSANAGDRLVRWRPDYLQEVRHMLSHFAPLGITHVGIACPEDAASKQMLAALTAELGQGKLQLSGIVRIGHNDRQMAADAAKLANSAPGVVLVIGDTIQTAQFLQAFRPYAPKVYVAGSSLTNLDTLRELAGSKAVEWTVFSQVVPNPENGKTALQREHLAMMKKYRDEPPSTLTLEGFAVAKTLALAIRRGKPGMPAQEIVFNAPIDIGGLSLRGNPTGDKPLSDYLDLALFRRNGLVF